MLYNQCYTNIINIKQIKNINQIKNIINIMKYKYQKLNIINNNFIYNILFTLTCIFTITGK